MEADLKNENLLLIVKRRGRSSYGILMKNDKVKKKVAKCMDDPFAIRLITSIHQFRRFGGNMNLKNSLGDFYFFFFFFYKNTNHYSTAYCV